MDYFGKVDAACRAVFAHVEWKYPGLYGFLQNPSLYASKPGVKKNILFRTR